MAEFNIVAVGLFGAVAYAAGAYIAVGYVLPKVKVIAAEVLRYPKTADALVYLLSVAVYLLAAQGIINQVASLGSPANYINLIKPALEVLNGLVPTVKLVLIGIGVVLLAERIRLRA